jgi:RNA polymerase sigma-70 factor (ECF subfamily)
MSGLGGRAWTVEAGLAERYHPVVDPASELERRDLRRVLDDELLRLPEKYRAPVVLCDLEGWTHDAAARRLGWPAGSMSRRLGRARRLLRRRLLDRGLTLAAIGLCCAAMAALGIGWALDRTQEARVVQGTMTPFRPRGEGGQGLGRVLTALSRADEPLPEVSQVLRLARAAARSAARLAAHDPGQFPEPWRDSASQMQAAALELARATEQNDQRAVVAAARRLDASCLKCHELFRPRVGRVVGATIPAEWVAFPPALLKEYIRTQKSGSVGWAAGSERFRGDSRNGGERIAWGRASCLPSV